MIRVITMMRNPVIVRNALKVSAFVGTCLNLINQGPVLWDGGDLSVPKLFLNYAVPYLVSSYSAAKFELSKGE